MAKYKLKYMWHKPLSRITNERLVIICKYVRAVIEFYWMLSSVYSITRYTFMHYSLKMSFSISTLLVCLKYTFQNLKQKNFNWKHKKVNYIILTSENYVSIVLTYIKSQFWEDEWEVCIFRKVFISSIHP